MCNLVAVRDPSTLDRSALWDVLHPFRTAAAEEWSQPDLTRQGGVLQREEPGR